MNPVVVLSKFLCSLTLMLHLWNEQQSFQLSDDLHSLLFHFLAPQNFFVFQKNPDTAIKIFFFTNLSTTSSYSNRK